MTLPQSRRAILATVGLAWLAGACGAISPRATTPATPAPASRAPASPTRAAPAVATAPVPTPPPEATPTAPAATPTRSVAAPSPTPLPTAFVPPLVDGRPAFSDVSQATPADAVAFLTGRDARYPGSGPASVRNFSPSDILETMDTIVLDQVRQNRREEALLKIYEVIAADILATLRDAYGSHWVLLALDAGHGGNKSYFWDPGSEGTEAGHTRGVVAALDQLAKRPENGRILVRHIFNDAIADDFGLGGSANRATVSTILMRQVRAAMLAVEARAWDAAHPGPSDRVFPHEVSVHFNAGAGGALVLHQGETVSPAFKEASTSFGRQYLHRVVPDLNATGLLPDLLTLWGGSGLHDDVMMYRPAYLTSFNVPANFTPRYGELQGSSFTPRFIQMVLAHQTATTAPSS